MRLTRTALSTLILATTWVNADILLVPEQYTTIQSAVDDATTGDRISVAPGTYHELVDMLGKEIQLSSRDGAETTTIDATGLDGSCILCWGGEGFRTIIAGFTLTGGTGTENPDYNGFHGGGAFVYQSSPTFLNCIITANNAEFGGGMLIQQSSSYIGNVLFENNNATHEQGGGGGLYCFLDSSATIANSRFVGNTSSSGGGLKCKHNSNATILNCRFTSNASTAVGGAFTSVNASPSLERCLFENNTAATYGGGSSCSTGTPSFTKCEFRGNSAKTHGGGIRFHNSGSVLDRCGFTDNTGAAGGGGIVAQVGEEMSLVITNSSFQENNGASLGGAIYMLNGTIADIDTTNLCGNSSNAIDGTWNDNGGNTMDASCEDSCPGDVNASGTVDIGDLLALVLQYGPCNGVDSCFGDQNADGQVDIFDLLIVIQNFGTCP